MRTSNERNNIGIIGIILLIANWVFVFGINSYMYDHRNENSGLLPEYGALLEPVASVTIAPLKSLRQSHKNREILCQMRVSE